MATYNNTGTGGSLGSGASSIKAKYKIIASGQALMGGRAGNNYYLNAVGGSIGSGTIIRTTCYKSSMLGGILGGGHGFTTYDLITGGGCLLSGSFLPVHNIAGSGGATVSGLAISHEESSIADVLDGEGCLSGGRASVSVIYTLTDEQGALLSGTGLITADLIASGGSLSGGVGFYGATFIKTGTAEQGTKIIGSSTQLGTYNVSLTGEAILGGGNNLAMSSDIGGGAVLGGLSRSDIGIIAHGGVLGTGGLTYLTVLTKGGISCGGQSKLDVNYNFRLYNDFPGGLNAYLSKFSLNPLITTSATAFATIQFTENLVSWSIHYQNIAPTEVAFYNGGTLKINLGNYCEIKNGMQGQVSLTRAQILEFPTWSLKISTFAGGILECPIVISGTTATIQTIHTMSVDGGIVCGGSGIDAVVESINGGVIVSGVCRKNAVFKNDASGNIVLSGSVISSINGIVYVDEQGRGGVIITGACDVSGDTSEDNTIFVGSGPAIADGVICGSPVAGATLGGIDIANIIASGGATLGSSTSINVIYTEADRIPLTGGQVIPPKQELYCGSALISMTLNTITWEIDYSGPESRITSLKIRGPADVGSVGATCIDLGTYSGLMMPNSGSYTLSTFEMTSFTDPSQFYLEIYDNFDPILRGQIFLNGTGCKISGSAFAPQLFEVSGGIIVNGETTILHQVIVAGSGGAKLGGTAAMFKTLNKISRGGVITGSATSVSFVYGPVCSKGVLVGGKADVLLWLIAKGGALIGGGNTLLITRPIQSQGGALIGGIASQQNFYLSRSSFGGVTISGKAKTVRDFNLTRIQQYIYRYLISQNILKDYELSLIRENQLFQIKDEDTPLSDREDSGSWCDVEIKCPEGVLPQVAQDRQTILPPHKITLSL